MNNFAAQGSALYGRLGTVQYTYSTGGTATYVGTVGTYDSMAPQGTNPPYIIFQFMTSRDDYAMSSKPGESSEVMVKAVSNRYYPSQQAYAMYATAHDNLQNASLSVAGNTLLRCQRRSRFSFRDAEGFWNVGGIYRVETWQT